MKTLEAIKNADNSLAQILTNAQYSNEVLNKDVDRQVRALTLNIKKELKVDYSRTVNFKPKEKERLQQIFLDYLTGKSDDFNSHYIQLLAWHLQDLKILTKKDGTKISIFEYSPNPLAIHTIIEKTFKLFQKKRINVDKISFALILNYLNNYKIASNRYRNVLKSYLKSIHFSEDLDVYFNIKNVITYTNNKTSKQVPLSEPFPERLLRLHIRPRTLDTVYFADAWFAWMFNVADLSSDYVLKNLRCNYFKICNPDYQKIIIAKIIYDNDLNYTRRFALISICLNYLFPVITKGNPFKKDFWDLNYTGIYKTYLDSAWNFIEQTFVNDSQYKNMVNFEG